MFQNKRLKRNATYAIAEVAEVALCASNCALPTSGNLQCIYSTLYIYRYIQLYFFALLLNYYIMYLILSKLLNYRSHLYLSRRPIVRGCRLDDCAISFRIQTIGPFTASHRKDHNIVFLL